MKAKILLLVCVLNLVSMGNVFSQSWSCTVSYSISVSIAQDSYNNTVRQVGRDALACMFIGDLWCQWSSLQTIREAESSRNLALDAALYEWCSCAPSACR